MKPLKYAMLVGGAVWVSSGVVRAIEGPEDNAPPPRTSDAPAEETTKPDSPPASRAGQRFARPVPVVREKSAYLGAVTGEVPGVVADQLGLEKGAGVVVESLQPDGPAKKAGIMENDVLLKADGRELSGPSDVFSAVGGKKPGDSIPVELIRRGKPVSLSVTLGERPGNLPGNERRRAGRGDIGALRMHGLPDDMARRLQGMIEESVGGVELKELEEMQNLFDHFGEADGSGGIHEKMDKLMEQARGRVRDGRDGNAPGHRKLDISSMATIRLMDNHGSIEIKTEDGAKKLSVRDQNGKETWSGPWDSEQDKAAAPADVRRRVEALNIESFGSGKGMNLKFNFNHGGEEDDGIR